MKVEMSVPSPGESITEVQIARWIKKDGDIVEKDDEIAEIDSDKATLTLNASESGKLKILKAEGETIKIGEVVCSIDTAIKATATKKETDSSMSEKKGEVKSKPAVSAVKTKTEIQKPEQKITLNKPASISGLISRQQATDQLKNGTISFSNTNDSSTHSFIRNKSRGSKKEKMTMLRKRISERLVSVKNETAMLTTFNEVDMSAIINIRKQYKDKFKEQHGTSLGFMSFFTKAVTEALIQFPAVNAMIDGDEVIFHEYCDIGIAVSAPKGLMVPVIRNAESLTMNQIESVINELATKARDNKLTLEEMSGGTFTISNGGVFGSLMSTPILNPPQSAILGMHNIVERPMAINGQVQIRPMMYIALSYDHRIIDGRESVSFLVAVKQMLENPIQLILNGKDPIKKLLDI